MGASGQPIGSFGEFDFCSVVMGDWAWSIDFGADGSWLRETWNLDSDMDISDHGAQIYSGAPDEWAYVPTVHANWHLGAGPAGQEDWFAVRYTTTIDVAERCAIDLLATADDGFVVTFDGETVLDDWRFFLRTWVQTDLVLEPGEHRIEFKGFEGQGYSAVGLYWRLDR